MTLRGARALPLIALVGSLVVLALPAAATPSTNRGTATLSSLESGVLQQLNKNPCAARSRTAEAERPPHGGVRAALA